MDLIQRLLLFADIVEKGSIASAARARFLTRSAISKQLAKLEEETGTRLLNRNTRSMSLSGPGEQLYQQACRVRESHQETLALIARLGNEVSGNLRLASSIHFGRFYLADAITAFSEAFDQVVVSLQLGDAPENIVSENIDLAIRIGALADSRLVARRLCRNPVALVASPELLEQLPPVTRIDQVSELPCISYESNEVLIDRWIYLDQGSERAIEINPVFKANDGQVLLDACLRGRGLALLPTYVVAGSVDRGELRVVLPDVELRDYAAVHMIYASRRYHTPALEAFLEFMRSWVEAHPVPTLSDLAQTASNPGH